MICTIKYKEKESNELFKGLTIEWVKLDLWNYSKLPEKIHVYFGG